MGSKSAIGIGNGICFKQVRDKDGGSYIDPLVRDSIVGLWKFDQNTNESPTRNIIKNTIKDKGGDLELLNFGYKLNSGYEKYEEDFTSWEHWRDVMVYHNKFTYIEDKASPVNIIHLKINKRAVNSFKIKVEGLPDGQILIYSYFKQENDKRKSEFLMKQNGEYILPPSMTPGSPTEDRIGFYNNQYKGNIKGLTITQIPFHQGALVTDGKDDMIVSQKTVQEMLGGSKEITVVSMIHQIGLTSRATINNICSESVDHIVCRNICSSAGKTGIYGYSKQINTNNPPTLINNILGDKKDYTAEGNTELYPTDKFFVQGYKYNDSLYELSEVAVYWTFIANKVLTTDEINQIIGHFKLDKYVTPQVIYDVKRQGLTNDTPAADWYLKDFRGNGHDMQLYNFGRTTESGINDEGALVSDGKDDYGYADNLPIFKDYTVAIDRAWIDLVGARTECLSTKNSDPDWGAFNFELSESISRNTFSFGGANQVSIDVNRKISYQSKYSYNGATIAVGSNIVDGKDLFLFRSRSAYPYYAKAAIWSYLLFPYSLSEFLLERQLKRYKLGTLYPGMIEWRPKVNINVPVVTPPTFSMNNGSDIITNGQYIPEGTEITIRIFTTTDSSVGGLSEVTAKINGVDIELSPSGDKTYYGGKFIVSSEQKIDITIDEYIRYEDIVQPYPAIINLKQDGKTITWGDKLKVGSDIVFAGSANLLPELYTVSETRYNGVTLYPNTIIKVEKSMVFDNARTYLKANEPNCILSPNRLRIPNSSYKILGYIPDLTGNGNHGRLNNFAYTEESGANEDGSIRFDGADDHITIPTLSYGGKQVLMKVNLQSYDRYLYDQRNAWSPYLAIVSAGKTIAYEYSNKGGKTYIDGILNEHIIDKDLLNITHNITATNSGNIKSYSPNIGTSFARGNFAQMALFDFMLFPEISSEEEIQELNDIVGIEGGYVESPNYYYDVYGKKNTDTDRNLIADQVSKDVANALEVKNVAYNSESGYTDDNGLLLDGVDDKAVNTVIPAVTDFTVIGKRNILNYESVFAVKGDNTTSTAAFVLEYGSDKFYNFDGVNTVEYPNTITVATKSSYNNNPAVSSQGIDSLGLRIGEYRNYYSKLVFYKLMLYTKTIDQLSINMLKNLFERDELIDITNPIFKKKEL